MNNTALFEAFIARARSDIPACPNCGNPTGSAFVCYDCRVIHCWYCQHPLREVPKNLYRDAERSRRVPPPVRNQNGQPLETVPEILQDTLDRLKNRSMDEVLEYVQQMAQDLNFTCPGCQATLDHIHLCDEGHIHCKRCDIRLRDMPVDLWGICVAHDAEEFHAYTSGKEPGGYVH